MLKDGADGPTSPQVESQVFIARQPILDRSRRVMGYELLFRETGHDATAGACSEQASARVLTDAVMAFGLDTLTFGKPAFINVTRGLLNDLAGLDKVLPPSKVVLELLEDIEGDEEVKRACLDLKRAGYALALDDFVLNDRTAPLVPLATYIKLDTPLVADEDLPRRLAALCPDGRPFLLAEKVETFEQFTAAYDNGFDYFQGFFFGRPRTQRASTIPGHQIGYIRLLEALQDPELDPVRFERLVEHDPALCYRLLRTVNSAGFAQRRPVTSIRQAIVLMGVGMVRRWASLWLLAGLGETAHPELLTMASIRARSCELVAEHAAATLSSEGFLLGMCSLLDAILDQPMPSLVEQLPLSGPVQSALLGEDNTERRILDCAIAQERGDWSSSEELAERAGVPSYVAAQAHQSALRWSAEFLQGA
jgi:c-di-GMP-related signal transduction protein